MHPPAIGVTLNNYERGQSTADRLHMAAAGSSLQSQAPMCPGQICLGSVMAIPGRGTIEPRPLEQVLSQARKLLEQYYATLKQGSDSFNDRFKQVELEVSTTGTYILTKSELLFGAKLAWRNSARCIGRIQWNKLHLFDCRHVTTCQEMFDALCTHIQFSTNNGNIRSAITVFPPRTSSRSDFRVWNPQLLSYAGYKNADGSIIGDPINVEFTEVCTKLGWQGEGTQWDILPLVLSSATEGPKYYELPTELVLQVHLTHPSYDWFEKLGIRWYGLPAVSGMLFDCGGVEFPAAPFNGWYMSTEIGCRDLCDPQRYNMLETVAVGMGMDTSTSVNLWKDKALVEVNIAVIHSFQKQGVTIVDHHTASSNFMKHMENEQRLRGGCPADWVWIVPPMSGSITPVFHQEMAMYHLKPSFDYQESAWKSHPWKEHAQSGKISVKCKKFHFKQIARAVCLTIRFYRAALLRRIKATVLYATETGKSETYAKRLTEIFNHSFNATVYCMDEFDIEQLPHESLLLIVASTFGNGDAPENGEKFAHSLEAMKSNQVVIDASEDKLEEKTSSILELISEMAEAVNYRNKAENEQLNDQLDTKETTPDDNVSTDNVSNKNHDSESTEAVITNSEVQNSVSGEEASCGADYAGLCSGGDKDSPVPREHDVTAPIDEVSPQKHGTNELKGVVKNSQAAKKNSFSKLPSYIVDSLTEVQEEGETEENRMNGRLFEMGTNEATLLDETMNTTNRISESEDHTVSSILSIISEVKDAGSVKRQMKHINAIKSCIVENVAQMTGKPLQHIRYSVFALGSSVYPNFCAFGHYMDHLLARLGGKRLLKVAEGDEMKGQRRAFRKWVAEVFPAACEAFNVEGDSQFIKETFSAKLSMDTVRFVKAKQHQLDHALSKYHNKKVSICQLLRKTNLHSSDTSRSTLLLELDAGQEIQYQPGDHVGVFPCNRKDIVDGVLSRLTIRVDLDVPVQVQVLKANNTSNGTAYTGNTPRHWKDYRFMAKYPDLCSRRGEDVEPHDTVPSCSLRTLLTWFLDITTPLAPIQLENLASVATDPEEQRRLLQLATNPSDYEEWRNWKFPHLLEVLTEFPSVRPTASLLVTHLNPLQPRFYSISSSPEVHPGQIHLTVAVVNYKTQGGKGPTHYGVCSNFLQDFPPGQNIHLFVRSAHNFSLPLSRTLPVIMVGPGTGIAPFRGFWQHKMAHAQASGGVGTIGHMWLFFGCQRRTMDLYHEEKEMMTSRGVLDKVFLALSREPSVPKTYVQDLLIQEAAAVYHKMMVEGGHFYVCGDCTMAQDVHQTLQRILMEQGNMTQGQAEGIMHSLKEEKRYHEDIFGITLHTTARIQMAAHADDGPHDVRGGVAA